MTKNANFAGELETISTAVERDVGRVITLLRDEQASDADVGVGSAGASHSPQDSRNGDRLSDAESSLPAERAAPRTRSRTKVVAEEQVILENVTTRLSRETNELLTEAALRQKLAKQTPDTRQDIIETAVRHWLKTNRYWRQK
jgi:hypothetical protein